MQQIETDIAENADINFKLVTGVTYDISKKKKKKKKKNPILTGGGKWGAKPLTGGGGICPPMPPPPWCRHCPWTIKNNFQWVLRGYFFS